jgi:hypothetical protein
MGPREVPVASALSARSHLVPRGCSLACGSPTGISGRFHGERRGRLDSMGVPSINCVGRVDLCRAPDGCLWPSTGPFELFQAADGRRRRPLPVRSSRPAHRGGLASLRPTRLPDVLIARLHAPLALRLVICEATPPAPSRITQGFQSLVVRLWDTGLAVPRRERGCDATVEDGFEPFARRAKPEWSREWRRRAPVHGHMR